MPHLLLWESNISQPGTKQSASVGPCESLMQDHASHSERGIAAFIRARPYTPFRRRSLPAEIGLT